MSVALDFLSSTRKLFLYYKSLGEKALAQVDDEHLHWRPNATSNSLALIVHHLSGNMLSRFTDFLTSDGEKPWRRREAEFEEGFASRADLLNAWEKGWQQLFTALDSLTESDLSTVVYIRNEGHTVLEALQRQLAHYPHHVGQMLYLAKQIKDSEWVSLSIARGSSEAFNQEKFSREKSVNFFSEKS